MKNVNFSLQDQSLGPNYGVIVLLHYLIIGDKCYFTLQGFGYQGQAGNDYFLLSLLHRELEL